MNIEDLRLMALSLPNVTERCPYGPDVLTLEIGGKQFCLLDLSCRWDFYNIKVDPDYSEELRERYLGITPGFHMNKKHWVSVRYISDVPENMHRQLIEHAYRQTMKGLPKKLQMSLMQDLVGDGISDGV